VQILKTLAPSALNVFYEALVRTGQQHLAVKLEASKNVHKIEQVELTISASTNDNSRLAELIAFNSQLDNNDGAHKMDGWAISNGINF
jgi:hypothetical protein